SSEIPVHGIAIGLAVRDEVNIDRRALETDRSEVAGARQQHAACDGGRRAMPNGARSQGCEKDNSRAGTGQREISGPSDKELDHGCSMGASVSVDRKSTRLNSSHDQI